jgi:hypothetical protein
VDFFLRCSFFFSGLMMEDGVVAAEEELAEGGA